MEKLTVEQYKNSLKRLQFEHEKKVKALNESFVEDNALYKKGDILRNKWGDTIKVLKPTYQIINTIPRINYYGQLLNKDLSPKKNIEFFTMCEHHQITKVELTTFQIVYLQKGHTKNTVIEMEFEDIKAVKRYLATVKQNLVGNVSIYNQSTGYAAYYKPRKN